MPDLRKEIVNILDSKRLTPYFQARVFLTSQKTLKGEAIRVPADSSPHHPFNLLNVDQQLSLNTRLELICRDDHGLAFRRLRLF